MLAASGEGWLTMWIFLVLAAQFTWAAGNFLDKWLLSRYDHSSENNEENGVGILLLFSAFFGTVIAFSIYGIGHLLVYANVLSDFSIRLSPSNALLAILVGVLEILWLVPYFHALRKADEIVAAPLFQSVPIFGFLLGFFIFGETPTILHVLAGSVILLGSIILNCELAREQAEKRITINWSVVVLMLTASFIVSLAAFLFKEVSIEESYSAAAFWMSIGAVIAGAGISLLVPTYRRQFFSFLAKSDSKGIAANVLNEFTDNIAILAFYAAIVTGPSTALVQSTVAYQPVFLLLIGFVAARLGSKIHMEKLSGRHLIVRIIGITIIVLGSLLIFL